VHEALYYQRLAHLNETFWVARTLLTFAAIWLFIDLSRGASWGSAGLKAVLGLTSGVAGVATLLATPGDEAVRAGAGAMSVWALRAEFGLLITACVLGLLDAVRDSDPIRIPESGPSLAIVLAGAIIGLGFPAFDLLHGNVYPSAQTFGISAAPFLVVLLPLLGATRPASALTRSWFVVALVLALDVGIVAPLLGFPHGRWIVAVAAIGGVYVARRR